jgi:hypothetical protein
LQPGPRGGPRRPHPLPVAIPLRGYVVCNLGYGPQEASCLYGVAIPLRGYVVCNGGTGDRNPGGWNSRNPLTGLSGLQPGGICDEAVLVSGESQSPYGAKWFATAQPNTGGWRTGISRNPLAGLSGLQQAGQAWRGHACPRCFVAIPLRGYVVCNWEDLGRGVKGECIGEYRCPRGKKLVFKVPSRIPGTRTL